MIHTLCMFSNYGELNSTVKFGKTVRKVFADIIFANSSRFAASMCAILNSLV